MQRSALLFCNKHINAIKDSNAARLYIKDDYGTDPTTKSSYYLGENKQFTIAERVIKLIESLREHLNIKKENTIMIGSSKGGYAALYFGYKGSYGHVIAGGPQVLLGNYLTGGKIDNERLKTSFSYRILHYIVGDINEDNIIWANNILFNIINEGDSHPNIYIHVGEGEPHYKRHVAHLITFLKQKNISHLSLDLEDYSTHEELAMYFPGYLKETIDRIVN